LTVIAVSVLAASAAAQSWKVNPYVAKADLVAIYFTSSDKGFVAGDGGFLAGTSDGGRTWSTFKLNTTEDINEIYFRNERNGYLVAGRKLFITSDGGTTWRETVIFRPGEFGGNTPTFLSIRFPGRNRGFAIGSLLNSRGNVVDSLVLRTNDGGTTWQRTIVPSKLELFHLDFDGEKRGWIVGDDGLILATTDGGDTWNRQVSGVKAALYNVDFHNEDEGYAVGEAATILRTENGGATWERVRTPFTGSFMRVDFADKNTGWVVGHKGMVLRSSDKGKTWVQMESSTNKNLYGLFMTKKYGWAVGAGGVLIEHVR
jgi:photosystem II stability/assembly factor-like uncharacterized protein